MRIGLSKEMDPVSVQNPFNWEIGRATGSSAGGEYNWGLQIPSTEIGIDPHPDNIVYDATMSSADVTFSVRQNSAGNGTIDPSHIVFKFNGVDAYGKAMDPAADEFSGFSAIA